MDRTTDWKGVGSGDPVKFRCGDCNHENINSRVGLSTDWQHFDGELFIDLIRICPRCRTPTFLSYSTHDRADTSFFFLEYTDSRLSIQESDASAPKPYSQIPAPLCYHSYTDDLIGQHSREVLRLFDEADSCFSAGYYSATAMLCRKIIMNIAVTKFNYPGNKNFSEYIQCMKANNDIGTPLVSRLHDILRIGNDANHEIPTMDSDKAKETLELSADFLQATRHPTQQPNYRLKNRLPKALTKQLHKRIQLALPQDMTLIAKVRIDDIIKPVGPRSQNQNERQKALNAIQAKHFDFIVFCVADMKVIAAIELYVPINQKPQYRQRDQLLKDICQSADIRLIRIAANGHFTKEELQQKLSFPQI